MTRVWLCLSRCLCSLSLLAALITISPQSLALQVAIVKNAGLPQKKQTGLGLLCSQKLTCGGCTRTGLFLLSRWRSQFPYLNRETTDKDSLVPQVRVK